MKKESMKIVFGGRRQNSLEGASNFEDDSPCENCINTILKSEIWYLAKFLIPNIEIRELLFQCLVLKLTANFDY